MAKVKTIEEKYQSLSEIDHILLRSGMYVGSIKNETSTRFLYNAEDALMNLREVEYVPAILKIIDEIISNSCDEFRRTTNLGLDEITVRIDNNGEVIIRDNGGIPVAMHKTAKMYVPEFIFTNLRVSSNYDDSENRDVIGLNGLGSTLTAIFSSYFSVYTADKKKSYFRSWENNLRQKNNDEKIKACKDHFTELHFKIDFDKFEDIDELSDDFIDIIEKRCIDAAAANIGLTVKFEHIKDNETIYSSDWNFQNFDEYIDLYSSFIDRNAGITFSDKQKSVWVFPDGNINIGFVNGAECSKGTHIKAVHNEVNNAVSSYISSKKKLDVQPRQVDDKYSSFCVLHVDNPTFDSQTKDTLTTPVNKFEANNPDYKFNVPKKFLDEICKSDIIDTVVDWFKQKQEVEDQKTLRKLNKDAKQKIARNDKFIDANSKHREDRELWIFEGDSAQAGFRKARDPQRQAAYMLRGVTLNTIDASPSKVMANKELADLVSIIGLKWGEKNQKTSLNFNRIVISTDMDFDGSKIAGILLVFFNKFPELFEYEMVMRSISPIMIASKKGCADVKIYSMKEYKEREKELKGYTFKYAKGLGSLDDEQYKEMIQRPTFVTFTKDELADMSYKKWFGKKDIKTRRSGLENEVI